MKTRLSAALPALVILTLTALLLLNLGRTTLFDMDETTYAAISRQIVRSGDWITLSYNGRPWFDKPPLFFWLTACCFLLFGFTESAARLPSVLAAAGTMFLTYRLGRLYFGERRRALSAVLILASSLQFYAISRLAVVDMLLTLFLTAALYFFLRWHQGEENYIYLSYTAAAMAVLTKGPVGLLLPGAVIVIYLLLRREAGSLKRLRLLSGTALFLCLTLPWFAAEYYLHGRAFIEEFFIYRTFTRYLEPLEQQSGPVYFYLVYILIGFFPWSLLLPAAVSRSLRDRRDFLPLVWCGFILLFFSAAGTKLPNYMMPLYPALALVTAGMLRDVPGLEACSRRMLLFRGSGLALAALALLGGIVWLANDKLGPAGASGQLRPALPVLAVLPAGILLSGLASLARRSEIWLLRGTAVTGLLFTTLLSLFVFPRLDETKPLPTLAARISERQPVGALIYGYRIPNGSVVYYADRTLKHLAGRRELEEALARGGVNLMLSSGEDFAVLPWGIREKFEEIDREEGRLLLRRRKPGL